MQTDLLGKLHLSPTTRRKVETMPAPQRAWALAKAAYETAHELNFQQQREATAAATADDPEPVEPKSDGDREAWRKVWLDYHKKHQEWYDRNQERIDAAVQPIVDRYPKELQRLMNLAERNMVEAARDAVKKQFPTRFDEIKVGFDRYLAGELYGQLREKLVNICFNCPL